MDYGDKIQTLVSSNEQLEIKTHKNIIKLQQCHRKSDGGNNSLFT